MKRNFQSLVMTGTLAVVALSNLSACAPMLLGGAVMTGVVATDRRTTGSQVEDEGIEIKVASAIRQELGDSVHLNVTSYNRQALLTGEVRTQAKKELAEKLGQSQEKVRSVGTDVAVTLPPSRW